MSFYPWNVHLRQLALLAFLAILLAPGHVFAAPNYRALLVGVSEYPGLEQRLQLLGPRNDVVRVRNVLIQRGFDPLGITVLADGVDGAALPTRANILKRLDDLARSARTGDYIVIHMAGHGSQQPVPPGSPFAAEEPDGLFEIFLPRDVGPWAGEPAGQGGSVRNAIIDHEIRAAVDRMTAAGAFVWAIFDACHSATLVRSAGSPDTEIRLRQVDPAALGIPEVELARASRHRNGAFPADPSRTGTRSSASAGRAVYFYAAQSTEPTPEMALPAGQPGRKRHGLFTYELMAGLDGGGAMTYRQLAQYVLARYGSIGEARATPLFAGTALDQPVLGQPASAARQWRLIGDPPLTVAAGALAEIQEGSVFAILPTPTSTIDKALGFAVASRVDLTTSTLTPVAHGDTPAKPTKALAQGTTARLVRPAMRFTLTANVDLGQCGAPCPFRAAIDELRAGAGSGGNIGGAHIQWAETGQPADVRLTAMHNRLWLLPPSMMGQRFCGSPGGTAFRACMEQMERSLVGIEAGQGATPQGLADSLRGALHAAARAANLMRIASTLGQATASRQLQTTIELTSRNGQRRPHQGGQVPRVADGDRIGVTLRNAGQAAVDVTALYLDSRHGIGVMFPHQPGASNRLEAGATQRFELEVNDSTLGLERLAIIAVQAGRHAERADFSFLAQPTLPGETVTRGSAAHSGDRDAMSLFLDAGFADFASRGARPAVPTERIGMQLYTWQVVR